jgi:hypothetical protein
MENYGGEGSEKSHWERRLFFNDIMTAKDYDGDFLFTIFNYLLL